MKNTNKEDLILGSLLIKQIKLLPSPIKPKEKKPHTPQLLSSSSTQSSKKNTRVRGMTMITKSTISNDNKPMTDKNEIPPFLLNNEMKIADFNKSFDEPSQKFESSLNNLDSTELENAADDFTKKEKKKFKDKSFPNSHKGKHDEVEEEEIYAGDNLNEDIKIDSMEKRIIEWLDGCEISIRDPIEKKDDYYQRKKNIVIKSSHNSPIKDFNDVDCNSPSLNLSSNSGLLMKRRMKSSNTVAGLEDQPRKLPSKFSQN